jgi:hypothetical protein
MKPIVPVVLALVPIVAHAEEAKLYLQLGHFDLIRSVAVSPDGRFVLTESSDGKLWQSSTGKWLAALISFKERGRAVVDPEGRYDASDPDSSPGIHFVAGNNVIELVQLKRWFYAPDLLARIWREDKLDLVAASLKEVKLVAGIELIAPAKDSAQAMIRLTNRSGESGSVSALSGSLPGLSDISQRAPGSRCRPGFQVSRQSQQN